MFLIVGADSEIGRACVDALRSDGTPVTGTSRRADAAGKGDVRLDLGDIPAGWLPPEATRAACIAAAVARLAECESDPAGAARVNCTGTIELAKILASRGVYTLFLSTNQVFDGTRPGVASEDPTSPVSTYGRQKAETEMTLRRMMQEGAPVGILRLSKVVSPGMRLIADWHANLAAGRTIRAFADMTLAPVPVGLVVRAIVAMMRTRATRVAQLTGPRDITYLDAGRYVAAQTGADPALVEAGRASELGLPPGVTPAHTTLDSGFLRDVHGIAVPDALDVVRAILRP